MSTNRTRPADGCTRAPAVARAVAGSRCCCCWGPASLRAASR